jgi:hypothetical protein
MSSNACPPDRSAGHAVRRPRARSRKKLYLRAGAGLVFLVALAAGTWWLATSPVFALRQVESGAYRYTDQADLERVFGTFLGQNIWTVRTGDVSDSMGSLPWVRDLQVHKRLPGGLEVDFREWRPVLALETEPGQPRLVVVEDGRVLPFPDHLIPPGLPLLLGVPTEPDSLRGCGVRLAGDHRGLVLGLLAAIKGSGLETVCPVDFVVARSTGYVIVLQNGQGTLLVGREEFSGRLDRYMAARNHLEPGLQMDLRFADRITCRRI